MEPRCLPAPNYTRVTTSPRYQYFAEDGHGNVTTKTDGTGEVSCTIRYNPSGDPRNAQLNQLCNTGSTDTTPAYRGARRDTDRGTYQLGSRTYDPSKAGFLTQDNYRKGSGSANLSVGADPLTSHRYAYVNGDPVNLVDSSGHYSGQFCRANDISVGECGVLTAYQNSSKAIASKIASIRASTGSLSPPSYGGRVPGSRGGNTSAQLAEIARLERLSREHVLFFDPGSDASAVVYGDLIGASNVAIVLDGTNSHKNFPDGDAGAKARAILETACPSGSSGCNTAAIAFDCAAPSIPGVVADSANHPLGHLANGPSDQLIALADLARGGAAAGANLTAIGHSYGSLVVGTALRRGLQVQNAILTGSEGVGVDSVAALHTTAKVFVGAAPGDDDALLAMCGVTHMGESAPDPVGFNADCSHSAFGLDPADPRFGAAQLDVTGSSGHNEHYVPGSHSLLSIVDVVAGRA